MSLVQGPLITLSGTTPNAASTAIVQSDSTDLSTYECYRVDADLVGATGGTLDVYLQRKLASNKWGDWLHWGQFAAGGAAVRSSNQQGGVFSVPGGLIQTAIATDASPGTPFTGLTIAGGAALAVRLVVVAGAGTSAGAAIAVYIQPYKQVR